MNKLSKILFIILALAMTLSLACVAVFATSGEGSGEGGEAVPGLPTEDAPLVDGAVFEVIASNGKRRTSGTTVDEFKSAVENYNSGDTFILLDEVCLSKTIPNGNGGLVLDKNGNPKYENLNLDITKEQEDLLNIDLNGYGIRVHENANIFSVSGKVILNVYSSREGGFLYSCSLFHHEGYEDKYNTGGSIFSISGSAKVHVGRFEKADGTVVPGSNISTTSAAFVNMTGNENAIGRGTLTVDGGTYYRFKTGGWVGLIIQRKYSAGTIDIKNANIVVNSDGTPFYLAGESSVTKLENCLLYHMTAGSKSMNMTSTFEGTLVLKDCVTSYNFAKPTYVKDSNTNVVTSSGKLYLEGENVFRYDALTFDFKSALTELKNGIYENKEYVPIFKGFYEDGYILARVSRQYEIKGNPVLIVPGSEDTYLSDWNGEFSPVSVTPVSLEGYAFVRSEQVDTYKFIDAGGQSFETFWKTGQTPTAPSGINLPKDKLKGIWKYGWYTQKLGEKLYTVSAVPMADFDVRVSYELYPTFALNVYVPKEVFNTYVNPLSLHLSG